jgi:hypothetical protein
MAIQWILLRRDDATELQFADDIAGDVAALLQRGPFCCAWAVDSDAATPIRICTRHAAGPGGEAAGGRFAASSEARADSKAAQSAKCPGDASAARQGGSDPRRLK